MLTHFLATYWVMVVTAMIGTVGYCLLFNIKKDKILYGCIGGTLSIVVYCICEEMAVSLLVQHIIAAAIATLYAELMARFVKAPATVFLLPAVIPLAPGGKLYYTMRAIVDGDNEQVGILGRETAYIALGIAIGIVLVSLVFYQFSHRHVQFRTRFGRAQLEQKKVFKMIDKIQSPRTK